MQEGNAKKRLPKLTTHKVWKRIFESDWGCPAHVYPNENDQKFCQKGFCCLKCEEKSCNGAVKCNGTLETCNLTKIPLEVIKKVYRRKKWRNYTAFVEEVQRNAGRN